MIEKVTSGEYGEGTHGGCSISIETWDDDDIAVLNDVENLTCIVLPDALAIVLEADRLAANARIAELEAQVAEMQPVVSPEDAIYKKAMQWQRGGVFSRQFALTIAGKGWKAIAQQWHGYETETIAEGKGDTVAAAINAALAKVS